MKSPYLNKPIATWPRITKRLLAQHPLSPELILEVANQSWTALWSTRVGAGRTAIDLNQLAVPATVVGYFFEVLFAKEMERRFPREWRGCRQGDEKDLVYIPDSRYSIEIKTSGQLSLKIFGNRSYGQKATKQRLAKKEKSGFYITVNFFKQTLVLIRFGWIDASDWKPQLAPTGQMAGLPDEVYKHKLVPIGGEYQLLTPVGVLPGVGAKAVAELAKLGIITVGELLAFEQTLPAKLVRIRDAAKTHYQLERKPTGHRRA